MKNKNTTTQKFYMAHFANRLATSISLRVGKQFSVLRLTDQPSSKEVKHWLEENSKKIREEFREEYNDEELINYIKASHYAPQSAEFSSDEGK